MKRGDSSGGGEGESKWRRPIQTLSLGTVLAEQYKSRNPMPDDGSDDGQKEATIALNVSPIFRHKFGPQTHSDS